MGILCYRDSRVLINISSPPTNLHHFGEFDLALIRKLAEELGRALKEEKAKPVSKVSFSVSDWSSDSHSYAATPGEPVSSVDTVSAR